MIQKSEPSTPVQETVRTTLLRVFQLLLDHFGQRHWWPGDTPLEISVGAILTQNCAWRNVERAIDNLKKGRLLDAEALYRVAPGELAEAIRPSGFFRVKTDRLKTFITAFYEDFHGSFEFLRQHETSVLRPWLLSIKGIGPETADSILLYALEKPVFVIDAYTRRFAAHHDLPARPPHLDYDGLQEYFMEHLPHDVYLFNEYHALIVRLCQVFCGKAPRCPACPLYVEKS